MGVRKQRLYLEKQCYKGDWRDEVVNNGDMESTEGFLGAGGEEV